MNNFGVTQLRESKYVIYDTAQEIMTLLNKNVFFLSFRLK